ncbi:unnamed protein product [Lampetra fluviatilis]
MKMHRKSLSLKKRAVTPRSPVTATPGVVAHGGGGPGTASTQIGGGIRALPRPFHSASRHRTPPALKPLCVASDY